MKNDWGPSAGTVASVRAKVAQRIAADVRGPDDSGPAPTVASPTSVGIGWKAVAGLVAIGLVGASFVWSRAGDPSASSTRAPTSSVATVATPAAGPVASPKTDEAPTEAVSVDSLPDVPPPPRARPGAVQPATSASAGDSLAEELVLLKAAQRSLRAGAPAEALTSLRLHATRFPQGVLREERMTLEVLALCDTGDTAGARAIRDRLAAEAPGSSHLNRLSTSCAAP
jgi:hypothetical protein